MGSILYYVAVLGLILMIMGVVGAVMYMFGYKKVEVHGRNKLQIRIKGIEVGIETGHVYFAIIVGLIMVIAPVYVAWAVPSGEARKVKGIEKATPTTPELEEGGYTISEDEIRIDLRDRKEVSLRDFFGGDLSETKWRARKVIKHVKSGVNELNFRYATSGYAIQPIEKPEDANWRRISKDVMYNPFIDLLRGKKSFKDLLARKGEMICYYMTVPITDGIGQEIHYTLKYCNAFQGRDFEWASKRFRADTDMQTIHITFPEDKPFKSFDTYKKDAPDAPKIRIDAPAIETAADNHILTWKISNAKKGEQYIIKWDW